MKRPSRRKQLKKRKNTRRKYRKQRAGGEIPANYPGTLVVARGQDEEDPPVLMSREDYLDTTSPEAQSA